MKDVIYLLFHLFTTVAKVLRPSGGKTIIAENLILKRQLIIHNRARQRAPNPSTQDRALLGFWSLFLHPRRITRSAIIINPFTLLRFHNALKKRKYRQLYSPGVGRKPGPKGPFKEVIKAIVEMKRRNPRFGCPRIAQQINLAFDLDLDKDTVRRVLATHYHPDPSDGGPSWLTTLGHAKDSLWSVDLFRCESILLKSHWVMVVMGHYTRRIIGFAVHADIVDGSVICRMFNEARSGRDLPRYLSSDNNPLFQYHRWKANLRALGVEGIKSLPHVPMSHPFVERLIGSIRRELLDRTLSWTATEHRCHSSLDGNIPVESGRKNVVDIIHYRWEKHCRGLFQLPMVA
jgi:transposase InsO family protein